MICKHQLIVKCPLNHPIEYIKTEKKKRPFDQNCNVCYYEILKMKFKCQ